MTRAQLKKTMTVAKKQCVPKIGVSEDKINKIEEGVFIEDPKVMCFIACVYKSLQVFFGHITRNENSMERLVVQGKVEAKGLADALRQGGQTLLNRRRTLRKAEPPPKQICVLCAVREEMFFSSGDSTKAEMCALTSPLPSRYTNLAAISIEAERRGDVSITQFYWWLKKHLLSARLVSILVESRPKRLLSLCKTSSCMATHRVCISGTGIDRDMTTLSRVHDWEEVTPCFVHINQLPFVVR
ncbi:unnamed protein product [Chilo suppressalis]|uniref:Uncharacterized protein n=1 Tax=Chilo suppressalis TaxID=168631 RepID=A0ABN8AZ34_CHISP|nr:unnamed protein product [Chilo suppressalis]